MEHYKETGRKTAFSATGSHIEWRKIKRFNTRGKNLNIFFITITEILNIQQIKKGDAVSILQVLNYNSVLGPLLFIIYVNDLPLRMNSVSEPILFADYTSVIISNRNFEDFCSASNLVLSHMIKWFAVNKLVLNLDKTNIMKYITKISSHYTLHIVYKEKYTE